VWVKREYGRDLCLWGTIGTQTTLPFGTPKDVREAVRRMIDECGTDGGLFVAPTHVIEPDVPWENIVALYEACREFGGEPPY
jgi:uroporphyrinogen decarboxylase